MIDKCFVRNFDIQSWQVTILVIWYQFRKYLLNFWFWKNLMIYFQIVRRIVLKTLYVLDNPSAAAALFWHDSIVLAKW